jgi:broad specificity phosphatase PhoE
VRFDAVYTSPLRRAVQTAALIAGETVPLRVDERLIEMDYGPYEGMDLRAPAPEVLAFFRDFVNVPAPAGMEKLSAVTARLGAFLEQLRPEAEERDILVSTHAIALKGALEYLTPESKGSYWSTYIENCAVYTSQMNGNGELSIPEKW